MSLIPLNDLILEPADLPIDYIIYFAVSLPFSSLSLFTPSIIAGLHYVVSTTSPDSCSFYQGDKVL